MEAARALLDSLMGHRRDEKRDKKKSGDSFLDKTVCKNHLVGFCPTNHMDNYFRGKECARRRVTECTLVHSDAAREELERHPDYERLRTEYEKDLLALLDSIASEADNIVRREKQLARPPTPTVMLQESSKKEIQKWEEDIKELMKQSEELAEDGKIIDSRESVDKARVLQKQIDLKKQSYTFMNGEQVCEVCGLRFLVGDNKEDKTNSETHKRSRMHTGYALVREKAEELREGLKRRSEAQGAANPEKRKEKEAEEKKDGQPDRRASRSRDRKAASPGGGREQQHKASGSREERKASRSRERRPPAGGERRPPSRSREERRPSRSRERRPSRSRERRQSRSRSRRKRQRSASRRRRRDR